MTIATPTVEEVRAVITTSLTDPQVQGRIDDSALIVEGTCVEGYSEARQKAIVKYLAAHFIAVSANDADGGGQLTQKSLGDASESYAKGVSGEGLKATSFGQQVLMFDVDGCLANIGKSKVYFGLMS